MYGVLFRELQHAEPCEPLQTRLPLEQAPVVSVRLVKISLQGRKRLGSVDERQRERAHRAGRKAAAESLELRRREGALVRRDVRCLIRNTPGTARMSFESRRGSWKIARPFGLRIRCTSRDVTSRSRWWRIAMPNTMSTELSLNGRSCADATVNSARPVRPFSSNRRRARLMSDMEISTLMTEAPRRASSSEFSPEPHPKSTTVRP